MFDFNTILKPYADRYEPHVSGAFMELRAFGHRILELMEVIADNTHDEPFISERKFLQMGNVINGQLTVLDRVPPTEEWEIESVAMVASVGLDVQILTGTPFPVWGGRSIAGSNSLPGNSVVITGNSEIKVNVSGGASLDSISVQVRRSYRGAPRPGVGGAREVRVDGDDATPNPDPGRHSGQWHPRGVV